MLTMTDTNNSAGTAESPLGSVPWRKIASVAGLVLLVAVVLPFVIYAVPQVVGADQSYVVLSGSMEPTISAGDVIIVNSVAASQIGEGDVITYGGERPTTHRVIGVTQQDGEPAFQTKGDANDSPDPGVVPASEVNGKVMTLGGALFVIPFIGHVIQFVNTPVGFALLFVIPFTLLVLLEIRDVIFASDGSSDSEPADGGTEAADGRQSVESAVPAENTAGGDADTEESGGGVTFSARELQLGLTVLAAFAAYSVWVSYVTTEVWAFAVTGSTVVAFVLLAGLYLFGGSAPEEGESTAGTVAATGGGGAEAPAGTDPRLEQAGPQPPGEAALDADGATDPGPEPVEFVREPGEVTLDGPTSASDGESTRGESDD